MFDDFYQKIISSLEDMQNHLLAQIKMTREQYVKLTSPQNEKTLNQITAENQFVCNTIAKLEILESIINAIKNMEINYLPF